MLTIRHVRSEGSILCAIHDVYFKLYSQGKSFFSDICNYRYFGTQYVILPADDSVKPVHIPDGGYLAINAHSRATVLSDEVCWHGCRILRKHVKVADQCVQIPLDDDIVGLMFGLSELIY